MERTERISLQNKATEIRIRTLEMTCKAGSGHPGGALSSADFIAACYFKFLNVDPARPDWPDRDRFVLSKGHSCPAQYAALAMRGFFPMETLDTLRMEGSILQGHPDMKRCPGIDISTGSLGQGLAVAAGMAIAGKMDGKSYRVYAVLGDGECQEGEIWEAAQTAAKYALDNLIVFVDNNGLQLDGYNREIMPNGDLCRKFSAFGFDCYEIDGNDMEQVVAAIELARVVKNGRPKCIVGRTVKGKGVSFMEDQCNWHGVAPDQEQCRQAVEELQARIIEEA